MDKLRVSFSRLAANSHSTHHPYNYTGASADAGQGGFWGPKKGGARRLGADDDKPRVPSVSRHFSAAPVPIDRRHQANDCIHGYPFLLLPVGCAVLVGCGGLGEGAMTAATTHCFA